MMTNDNFFDAVIFCVYTDDDQKYYEKYLPDCNRRIEQVCNAYVSINLAFL